MSQDELEAAVLAFLERREHEPLLTPARFAEQRDEPRGPLLRALAVALDLEQLLAPDIPGDRRIGPYRLLGELGRGGMGIVHRAERDGMIYALKLLPLAPVLGPRMRHRFQREVQALARLSHPGIVRVHDSGIHDEIPYLVMDLVEGRPLQVIAGALDLAGSVELLATLAEIVHAAHSQGVLHRDLKPQNVIVRPDGMPVLLDFGLSSLDESSTLTMTGDRLGTPRYMAPEQITGASIDARTDVHALGLILYELITGSPAHRAGSIEVMFDAVRNARIIPPRQFVPDLPHDLEAILLTATAREPRARYSDAQALAEDLRRFAHGERTQARRAGLWQRFTRAARAAPERLRASVKSFQSISAQSRLQANALLDRAICDWLAGDHERALEQLEQAHSLDPSELTGPLLSAHLTAGRNPEGMSGARAIRLAMEQMDAGAATDALRLLRAADTDQLRASLRASLSGVAAAHAGNDSEALEELVLAAGLLPESVRIQRTLVLVHRRLGHLEEAARIQQRVVELEPGAVEDWLDLAELHLQQRALVEGDLAIARARALSGDAHPRLLRIQGSLEILHGRQQEAQQLLARALELSPDDAEARYQLAYSLDSDHDMARAAAAYERVLSIAPAHVHALICLANLYSGASRGQCRRCDEFFAELPEYLDPGRAERYLLRALQADRGAGDWATRTARDIALRLEDRSGVIATLTELVDGAGRTPAVLRLEETLRRVQFLAG